jgi:segregation and condensation protein B
MMRPGLKTILEAMLFVAERPLTPQELHGLLPEFSMGEIRDSLRILQAEYEQNGRGWELKEVGGAFRLQSRSELKEWVLRLKGVCAQRLSRGALETLSIIAYKQPVSRAEIEYIRGVDVSANLRVLLDKKFIKIAGRKDTPGRPLLYGTTKYFLEFFGLRDISDLPALSELEDSGASSPIVLNYVVN